MPVPMAVRLVDRRYIVKPDTVVILEPRNNIRHKPGEILIAVLFQIVCAVSAGIGGQTVLCIEYRWGVQESEQVLHSIRLCEFKEIPLSGLLVPVISAVRVEKTFRPGTTVDKAAVTLFHAAGPDIETPDTEPDALRIAARVNP